MQLKVFISGEKVCLFGSARLTPACSICPHPVRFVIAIINIFLHKKIVTLDVQVFRNWPVGAASSRDFSRADNSRRGWKPLLQQTESNF
jgi:hypothetical protein